MAITSISSPAIRFGGVVIGQWTTGNVNPPYRIQIIAPDKQATEDMAVFNNPILKADHLVACGDREMTHAPMADRNQEGVNGSPVASRTAGILTGLCFDTDGNKKSQRPNPFFLKGAILECLAEFRRQPGLSHVQQIATSTITEIETENLDVIEFTFQPQPSRFAEGVR